MNNQFFLVGMAVYWAAFAGIAAVLRGSMDRPYWQTAAGVLLVYLATAIEGRKFAWVVIKTFPRDARVLLAWLPLQSRLKRYIRNRVLVHDVFRENVKRYPDKIAFLYEDKKWTFQDVENITNRIGNYFHGLGYRCGDIAAVFVGNSPELIFIWLGLSKIGVISVLLNDSLKKDGLIHCLSISRARALIFGPKLDEVVDQSVSELSPGMEFFSLGPSSSSRDLDSAVTDLHEMLGTTPSLPPPVIEGRKPTDLLMYVCTSGTTGKPKGAKITHCRFMIMSLGISTAFKLTPEDILYTTIPLSHSSGGILGVGQVLINGATMAIREKFSASRFWDEACGYNATCIQYIGEICRYMLDQPVRPSEKHHRVRVAVGNGLRPQIWEEFKHRFNIEQIAEFYGATEGNGNCVNMFQVPGSVGFISRTFAWAHPVSLIRIHEDTGEVIRGTDGLCVRCPPGVRGELVGRVTPGDPFLHFHGYADETATKRKIVENVFGRGDLAFRSGDILVMDDYGNLFFRDRLGDTFRWKGENVSTTEVEAIISNIVDLSDVCVYGVEIPGTEGKAGMAAIANLNVDLVKLNISLKDRLPHYTRPIFVKLVESLAMTGTNKFMKTGLQKAGYDPSHHDNNRACLHVMHPSTHQYERVDGAVYQEILQGKLRF